MLPFPNRQRSNCTLYTLDFTLHTAHYTPPHNFALYISTLHTPRCTLYIPLRTLPTLHSILYTPHYTTLNVVHSTPHSHFTLNTVNSTLYIPHSRLHAPTPHFQPRNYTPYSALHALQFALHILQFTLHALHASTVCTPHSTFYTPRSRLNTPM